MSTVSSQHRLENQPRSSTRGLNPSPRQAFSEERNTYSQPEN
jgi:hypothetical protein